MRAQTGPRPKTRNRRSTMPGRSDGPFNVQQFLEQSAAGFSITTINETSRWAEAVLNARAAWRHREYRRREGGWK